jgi:hypothetical protein
MINHGVSQINLSCILGSSQQGRSFFFQNGALIAHPLHQYDAHDFLFI